LLMSTLVYFVGQKYYPIPYKISRLLLYGGIVILAYLLNQNIGATDGFALALIAKILICGTSFGIIALMEIKLPLSWKK